MQGNDIGEDRVMTFSEVRDDVCRLVRLFLLDQLMPSAYAQTF